MENSESENSMLNSTEEVEEHLEQEEEVWQNTVVAFIMFFPNIPSLFAYFIFALVLVRYRQACKHAYYHFSASLAVSNAIMILLFLTYVAPVTYFQCEFGDENLHIAIGAISNTLWFANIPMYMIVAVNRYFNICRYHECLKIFTPKKVAVMITACWAYGFLYGFISLSPCCHFTYSSEAFEFAFDEDTFWGEFMENVDLVNSAVMIAVCLGFNVATFLYLRKNNKKIASTLNSNTTVVRMKLERKFLILSVIIAGSLFLHEFITITIEHVTESVWGGLVTTLTYILHLSLDGVVNVAFNKIVRDHVKSMIKCH